MRVASIQLEISDDEDKAQRVRRVDRMLTEFDAHTDVHPDIIILPELWGCGFFDFNKYEESQEELSDGMISMMKMHAERLGSCILAGSFIERRDGRLYNTSVFIDSTGKIAGRYSKMHLFGYESEESRILTAGEEVCVLDTKLGRIGLATCYDLRFPEQFRRMSELGADIYLVVSAWPLARLEHWKLFNRVRALENQAFLISCNCAGCQKETKFAGNSMMVAPDGTVIACADEGAMILTGEIDVRAAAEYRASFPALADRVPVL